jgi:quinoprotein dehydrogenase-associated probable ABC transporter substrate-binding protein
MSEASARAARSTRPVVMTGRYRGGTPGAAVLGCLLAMSVAGGCARQQPPAADIAAATASGRMQDGAATPATAVAGAAGGGALRVCSDPGNMPLSNRAGEGFQNKTAQVLADAMGLRLEHYWYTYYQRGLARSTINAGKCDVLMDMSVDYEQGLTTRPVYRSTYVLVSPRDRPLRLKSLSDPGLKDLTIGVFQSSPARQALYDHGVRRTLVQYLAFDLGSDPEEHPAKLVEQVAQGKLDAAEAWGPIAGYYARRDGLHMLPLNTLDDEVLEYSVALVVARKNAALRDRLNDALERSRDKIAAILRDYQVPLVQCTDCVVEGNLPSHGPYPQMQPGQDRGDVVKTSSPDVFVQMQQRVAAGADLTVELERAVDAGDGARVAWLLEHGADPARPGLQGDPALHQAIRNKATALVAQLLEAGANVDTPDKDGWTPLMVAALAGDAGVVSQLLAHKAKVNAVSKDGWTPLTVAIEYDYADLAKTLIEAGADPRAANPSGFTPVMFAVTKDEPEILESLLARGADVNRANAAGVTALMLAAAGGKEDVARRLLDAGAKIDVRDGLGRTAAQIAQAQGRATLVQLLSGEGARTQ